MRGETGQGGRVLDLAAGGGGKALALAANMGMRATSSPMTCDENRLKEVRRERGARAQTVIRATAKKGRPRMGQG